MTLHLVLIATPVAAGLLARLLRRPTGALGTAARGLRDLVTLRMVLRDTSPDQRSDLLRAHRAWRAEAAGRPGRAPQQSPAGSRGLS